MDRALERSDTPQTQSKCSQYWQSTRVFATQDEAEGEEEEEAAPAREALKYEENGAVKKAALRSENEAARNADIERSAPPFPQAVCGGLFGVRRCVWSVWRAQRGQSLVQTVTPDVRALGLCRLDPQLFNLLLCRLS